MDEGPHALVDVAAEVGLEFRHGAFRWGPAPDPASMMGSGLCWLDYDNDGWLDLFVVNSFTEAEASRWNERGGLPTLALFRNREGRFEDTSQDAGVDIAARGNGCVAADFDLDGALDLYVTSDRTNLLLWNRGDGAFEEGAVDAGVAASGWQSGAAVGDINGDGWPDLFVAGYADVNYPNPDATEGFPDTFLGVRDLLFLSNGPDGDGRVSFREVGEDAGLEAKTEHGGYEYGLGAVVVDVDGDADLDVYVANDTNPNRLYRNVPWPGGEAADPIGLGFRFEEVSAAAGVADDRAGMGIAPGDYDRNGVFDLFVTNLGIQGHGAFRDASSATARPLYTDDAAAFADLDLYTGWGVSWLDIDLDTDLDLVLANGGIPLTDLVDDAMPLQVFENVSDVETRFVDASGGLGLDAIGRLHGRGAAAADYDNDGDVDVAINSVGGPLVLLQNRGTTGNWLEVELVGFHPGASVMVRLRDGRELIRDVLAGSSYLSSEDPRAHFGLGPETSAVAVVITWPGGGQTHLTDIEPNQTVRARPPAK